MAEPLKLPPGATLVTDNPTIKLPPGASLVTPSAAAPSAPPQQGFFSSAADSSGLTGIAHAIAHPIDTIAAIPGALVSEGKRIAGEGAQIMQAQKEHNPAAALSHGISAIPILGPTLDKATDQYADKNYAGEMGTLTGLAAGVVAPTAATKALKVLPEGLQILGRGVEDAGVNRMNEAVGSRAADFKRGVNPGRSYLEAGGGPAMTMESLADKGLALKGSVGQQIKDIRNAATLSGTKIPVEDVAGALNPAISKGIALETGPGGLGNTAPIENYSASFRPTLKTGIANGGFTPNELQDLKSGIADNTNWSDPSQFNLKAIRQRNVGALSGVESGAIPEITPLKSQFQGLTKFADRAEGRALTHSQPLSGLVSGLGRTIGGGAIGAATGNPLLAAGVATGAAAGKTLALKTALAAGLYRGGGLLGSTGDALAGPASLLPSAVIPPYNIVAAKKKKTE
jgi:hypothetical protein